MEVQRKVQRKRGGANAFQKTAIGPIGGAHPRNLLAVGSEQVSDLRHLGACAPPGTQRQHTALIQNTQAGVLIWGAQGAVARPLYQHTSLKNEGGEVD